jgi:hypothetical protein
MDRSEDPTSSPCVVTIHGMGFEQPPSQDPPRAGYADALHTNLRAALVAAGFPALLGDDPNRVAGPVYVSSAVGGSREAGLCRLDEPLVRSPGTQAAHVALVYSPLEPPVLRLGAVADTLTQALLAHDQYVSGLGALQIALTVGWAALHEKHPLTEQSTLLPREDIPLQPQHRRVLHMLLGHSAKAPRGRTAGSFVQALEYDIATYITRNDLRERLRWFVEEALLRLLRRKDVSCLIINAHSQGTVLSWDVLCRIPSSTWQAGRAHAGSALAYFVTAGSPIRKYVDLFDWGQEVGGLANLMAPDGPGLSWVNFWDSNDPVADPLNPRRRWRHGDDPQEEPAPREGLLLARTPEATEPRNVEIHDVAVDNISNSSGGGLQAHDYWNNTTEFAPQLAQLLIRSAP